MKIHLLRHAKTEQFSNSGKDFDRKLTPKGLNQCIKLKPYLATFDFSNTIFLVSTANRTQQTFFELFSGLQPYSLDTLYLASVHELLRVINSEKTTKDIFIIGHNEGITELASYLSGQAIYLKTAQYLCLECDVPSSDYISGNLGVICAKFRPEA